MGETTQRMSLLTVLRVVPATAIAANVLYLFPDVTVNRKGHVVVVVRMLAVPFLVVAERHYFDQAERFFLGFLHRHGCVFSEPRGKPSTVHDGGCGIHGRVVARLEHWDAINGAVLQRAMLQRCGFTLKGRQFSPSCPTVAASLCWIPTL